MELCKLGLSIKLKAEEIIVKNSVASLVLSPLVVNHEGSSEENMQQQKIRSSKLQCIYWNSDMFSAVDSWTMYCFNFITNFISLFPRFHINKIHLVNPEQMMHNKHHWHYYGATGKQFSCVFLHSAQLFGS